ncbi:hypothetical protein MMYC01_202140 [Madurella mycetomatis]|uniref:JmjC domain-containing protein n=1 Tax=Madurella mycetomatis TaxID=100816 RepID=A0A175WB47_9PEZI|nr:hypothetical protein MMYC01_202140 [Madurella mycetomatis]
MPPAQHPQAKFDPIPPDLDLHALVERTPNLHWVLRISAAQIRNIGPQEFEKLVFLHVVHGGKPLVIEKWNDQLPRSLFSAEWLEATYNKKQESIRDIVAQTDIPMTMGHYLRSMKQLTNQWTPSNFRDERRQRLYMKDIDCPPEWQAYLQKVIPANLFYMNENVDERSGARRNEDVDLFRQGRSTAPAGDLMSSLPEEMRAQNLMCYVGHEGTYTPAHREMCASLGQNIMVDASGDENGEKPGSSIWFMTETKDREVVREYFLSMLGHDIEIEKHFAQINAWKKATFPVYVVEQKVGDFILVPPLAPHQVWNRGTRTIKVAWNRTTAETLQLALREALPKARLVCRDEQYKNKAIIYYTLEKYYKEMVDAEKYADIGLLRFGQDLIKNSARMKQMAADFKALFQLFTEVLVDEMFATREKNVEYVEFDSNITCSYCRANIFNRFLTCKNCIRELVDGEEDTYDICMECYVMGRSCFCVSNLSWCEQWRWSDLVDRYEAWRALIIKNDGYVCFDSSPLPLELARKRFGKKSVAQICQEQLRARPRKDINQVKEPSEPEESDVEVDDNGRPVKKKKKRKAKKGDIYRCHVCQHKDYRYKLAFCSNQGCTDAYCYGVLYRAFDMMPQEVMQNERWQCPKCLGICNCGGCRRMGNGNPYIPKTTMLGHDTRRIADDRSVESLVDFRVHNLSWLKNVGDESRSLSSKRMQRLQQAADAEKAKQAELAGEVPVLPDGALAESMDAAMQQPVTNGYGNQGGALGSSETTGEYIRGPDAVAGPQRNGDHAGPVEVVDTSLSAIRDQSLYPDPSTLGRERMLGMGYYEQDDSPDRILFDPYQMPTAEGVQEIDDEPEMLESLKKQLRLTKRRARQEKDDGPDFRIPKSHHKKKPKLDHDAQGDGQEVALSNMDPALLSGNVIMADALAGGDGVTQAAASAEVAEQATEQAEQITEQTHEPSEAPRGQDKHRPYSPNRPTLRHARPKISYTADEDGKEEFNEILVPRSQRAPKHITDFNAENANKDPLDLASAAISAMSGADAPAPQQPSTQPAVPRKRGRPPRKPDTGSAPKATAASTSEKIQRRRGRPPRARSSPGVGPDTGRDSASTTDLDAQLARQLEGFDDEGEAINMEPVSTPRDATTAVVSTRRRSRLPRNAQLRRTELAVEIPSQSMLSMADRMRLKGKKFKIGQRKSSGKAKPANPPTKENRPREEVASPPSAPKSPVRKAAPRATGRAGRRSTARNWHATDSTAEDEDFDPAAEEEAISENEHTSSSSRSVLDESFTSGAAAIPATAPAIEPKEPSPPPATSPSPSPSIAAPSLLPPTRAPAPALAAERPLRSPPPRRRLPSGPTIVRLLESDEEEAEYYGAYESEDDEESHVQEQATSEKLSVVQEPSDSDSDDDDDKDIPAYKQDSRPSRGRGTAIRGRGPAAAPGGRGRGDW